MPITLKTTGANVKTNYDGTSPTSFTCSNYLGMGNCSGGASECASWTTSGSPMSSCSVNTCSLCSNYDPNASSATVTPAASTSAATVPAQTKTDSDSANNLRLLA